MVRQAQAFPQAPRATLGRIEKQGQRIGLLHALHQGEFFFESELKEDTFRYLLNGESHPCLFDDLP